jgi:hypothetical protein
MLGDHEVEIIRPRLLWGSPNMEGGGPAIEGEALMMFIILILVFKMMHLNAIILRDVD